MSVFFFVGVIISLVGLAIAGEVSAEASRVALLLAPLVSWASASAPGSVIACPQERLRFAVLATCVVAALALLVRRRYLEGRAGRVQDPVDLDPNGHALRWAWHPVARGVALLGTPDRRSIAQYPRRALQGGPTAAINLAGGHVRIGVGRTQ